MDSSTTGLIDRHAQTLIGQHLPPISRGAHGSWKLWIIPSSLFTHFLASMFTFYEEKMCSVHYLYDIALIFYKIFASVVTFIMA